MCPTSNKLAFSRVHLWLSPTLRSEYWTGIEKPPKGTILPPFSTCRPCRAVRLRPPSLVETSSEDFLHCRSGVGGFSSQAEACRNGFGIAIGLLGRLLRVQVVVKVLPEHVGVRTEATLLRNAAVTFAPLILLNYAVSEEMVQRDIVHILLLSQCYSNCSDIGVGADAIDGGRKKRGRFWRSREGQV